jgi:hypothetical protein
VNLEPPSELSFTEAVLTDKGQAVAGVNMTEPGATPPSATAADPGTSGTTTATPAADPLAGTAACIPPIRARRGPRRRRPAKLHSDKGYDYNAARVL